MKQIKTIITRQPTKFDQEVNEALADGWTLVKRYCYAPSDPDFYFVAELEKEDEPEKEEEAPDEAAETAHFCMNCKYYDQDIMLEPCNHCIPSHHQWEPKA